MVRCALFAAVLAAVSGCESSPVLPGCPDIGSSPAVTVEAIDSDTAAPVTVGLAGTLADGDYLETMINHSGNRLSGVRDRPGRYTVVVSADGYEPWAQSGLVVTQGHCQLEGPSLTARMVARSTDRSSALR